MSRSLMIRYRVMLPAALMTLLLAACAPAATPTLPANTPVPPTPTEAAASPTQTGMGAFAINYNGLAQSSSSEVVAAVPASADSPWWVPMPQYERVTLEGYPVSSSAIKPQIFIYPVKALSEANKEAGQRASDLKALLASQQVGDPLPLMPLDNATQALHAQVKFLDFKNGQGVRFLTQTGTGMAPINNQQLFYTFQGLTSDGQYYVAAVLPVSFAGLPENGQTPLPTAEASGSGYTDYIAGTAKSMDEAAATAFTPDLAKLDAMIASLEIK